MKYAHVRLNALVASTIFLCVNAFAEYQVNVECNRDCLTGFLDVYLSALSENDSSQLPVTKNIKYTENGVRLNLTDGLWQTVTDMPTYRFDIVDEEAGSIAMLGIIFESGKRNFFSTRLKIEKGERISEIENLVVRNLTSNSFSNSEMDNPHPLFLEKIPEDERLSRAELANIGNSYFTAIDSDNHGENVLFTDNCQRQENGSITANNPDKESRPMAQRGCAEQFKTGFSVIVTDIRERRFVAVDPETGIAFAMGYFDHDGSVESWKNKLTGENRVVDPTFRQPFSFIIAEAFKIEKGKIRQIEAVLMTVPYGMPSGW